MTYFYLRAQGKCKIKEDSEFHAKTENRYAFSGWNSSCKLLKFK